MVGLDSTLGLVWMVALAKMLGGDEAHMDPAFDFIRRLMPNVGAVAANPGALGTLFQQGQIDISCHYINNVESLKAKGVPVALARPASNWGLVRSTMNIVKNTKMADLAAAYINTALSAEVQQQMTAAPYFVAKRKDQTVCDAEVCKAEKQREHALKWWRANRAKQEDDSQALNAEEKSRKKR